MFDIGAPELLVIIVIAILVIGPRDLPLALRTAGRWAGKARGVMRQFRSGMDAMINEAELDEAEKRWKAENERIMREHTDGQLMEQLPPGPESEGASSEGASSIDTGLSDNTESTDPPSGLPKDKS